MLPNFKVVICAIVFAVLLFAVTGAGVTVPETYTRIGAMPEVGRPMMQRMITDEPAQEQFHVQALARRSEELGRLLERTALEVETIKTTSAAASPASEIVRQAVLENPQPETMTATIAAVPALPLDGAMGTVVVPTPGSAELQPAIPKPDASPPDATPPAAATEPSQVAALPPTAADGKPPEAAPSAQVKVRHLRRSAATGAPHRRSFHRTRFAHIQARAQNSGFEQGLFGQPSFQSH
jgi:hypothetical protein